MKIVLINTSDSGGGAAIACKRLKDALKKEGADVNMLVACKTTEDNDTIQVISPLHYKLNFILERLQIYCANRFSKKNLFAISTASTGCDISSFPEIKKADILHLHWVNQGFLSLNDIQKLISLGKPVVITLHDMWYCTAICHHACGCKQFTTGCQKCFYLKTPGTHDLSAITWNKKIFLKNAGITFVPVSNWLNEKVKTSGLTGSSFSTVIPNTLDTTVFYPKNREEYRKKAMISDERMVIVFGAAKLNDPNKGFDLLKQALKILYEKYGKRLLLILFGKIKNDPDFLNYIPCEYRYMGKISEANELAALYSAADVTVVPSHYETFGQTLIESMACGTPGVSFDNSGQNDVIEHLHTGYLATYPSPESLAEGIDWGFQQKGNLTIKENCIERVRHMYHSRTVARQYLELYNRLLTPKNKD